MYKPGNFVTSRTFSVLLRTKDTHVPRKSSEHVGYRFRGTNADVSAGKVTFSYDFTAPAPAERVTFRSTITDAYIANIFDAI